MRRPRPPRPVSCPRCGGRIDGTGALSRADNATTVCSRCGVDEAVRAFTGQPLPARDAWPLRRAV